MHHLFALFFLTVPFFGFSQTSPLLELADEVYGTQCGFAGTPPRLRVTLEKWIRHDQKEKIVSWLKGPSPVRKMYAAEAILRMMRDGIIFGDEVDGILNQLQKSDDLIPVCSGCIHSKATISSLLAGYLTK